MARTLAFIGGGNMATSLIGGLIASGASPQTLRVAEPDSARAEILRQRFAGISVAAHGADIVGGADGIVLAVKPQQMATVLSTIRPDGGSTVISIAAGVRIDTLHAGLGEGLHYVRSMPNTPALYGRGISGLFAPAGTPDAAKALAEWLLAAAGQTVWVGSEADLDAVTAVSGSGPAYYFLLTEAIRDAGVALGLPADTARQLAEATLIGAARMVEAGSSDVVELRTQVTSKGGTTEAAIKALEAAGLRRIFNQALSAAARRSHELGDELSATTPGAG